MLFISKMPIKHLFIFFYKLIINNINHFIKNNVFFSCHEWKKPYLCNPNHERNEAKDNIKIGKFFESLKASIKESLGASAARRGAGKEEETVKNTQRAL